MANENDTDGSLIFDVRINTDSAFKDAEKLKDNIENELSDVEIMPEGGNVKIEVDADTSKAESAIAEVKSDIGGLVNTEPIRIDADTSMATEAVVNLRVEFEALKTEEKDLRAGLKDSRNTLNGFTENLQSLIARHGENSRGVAIARRDIKAYESDVKYFNQELKNNIAAQEQVKLKMSQSRKEMRAAAADTKNYSKEMKKAGNETNIFEKGIGRVVQRLKAMAVTAVVSAAIGFVVGAINKAIQKAKEAKEAAAEAHRESLRRSEESVKSIERERGNLDDLIKKYKELRDSENYDESARKNVAGVQKQITDLVGAQAGNLDLVNGNLDEQLWKLRQVAAEQNKASLRELEHARDLAALEASKGARAESAPELSKEAMCAIGIAPRASADLLSGRLRGSDADGLLSFWEGVLEEIEATQRRDEDALLAISEVMKQVDFYKGQVNRRDETENSLHRQNMASEVYAAFEGNRAPTQEDIDAYKRGLLAPSREHTRLANEARSRRFSDGNAFAPAADEAALEQGKADAARKYADEMMKMVDEIFPQYTNAAKAAALANEEIASSFETNVSNLAKTETDIAGLTSALDAFEKSGSVSAKTFEGLKASFGKLSSFSEFEKILGNSNSTMEEAQAIANTLATEYLNTEGAIGELNAGNAEFVESQLEAMGVTNAHELVMYKLQEQFVKNTLAQVDFKNMTDGSIESLIEQAKAAGYDESELKTLREALDTARKAGIDFTTITNENIDALVDEGIVTEATAGAVKQYAYEVQLASMDAITTDASIKNLVDLAMALTGTSDALVAYMGLVAHASMDAGEIAAMGSDAFHAQGVALKAELNSILNNASWKNSGNHTANVRPASSGGSSGGGGGRSNAARDAEDQSKAIIKAFEDEITERERLAARAENARKQRGELTLEDELRLAEERERRAADDADRALHLEGATNEQRLELFKKYSEAREDAELNIFMLSKRLGAQQVDEDLKLAHKYIDERNRLDDWGADSAIQAWTRVKTWLKQAYDDGKLMHDEYIAYLEEADNNYVDARIAEADTRYENSYNYSDDKSYFNEWDEGDSALQARERTRAALEQDIADGIRSRADADKKMQEYDKMMYENRLKHSYDWIAQQKEFGQMSYDEEVAAYKRIADYTQEYYNKGIIGRREYYEEMRRLDSKFYALEREEGTRQIRARYEALQKGLDEKQKALQEAYDAERALQDEQRRSDDLAELYRLEEMYKDAVTVEGQNKLKDIRNQIKALTQEEEQVTRDNQLQKELKEIEQQRAIYAEREKDAIEAFVKSVTIVATTMDEISEKVEDASFVAAATTEKRMEQERQHAEELLAVEENRDMLIKRETLAINQMTDQMSKTGGTLRDMAGSINTLINDVANTLNSMASLGSLSAASTQINKTQHNEIYVVSPEETNSWEIAMAGRWME